MDSAVEVAVLDRQGVVVATNEAWREFARANGGDPGSTGVGASYLAACATSDDAATAQVAAAIRDAIAGRLALPVQVLVPCPGPEGERWFRVSVSSRFADSGDCAGVTVALAQVPGAAPVTAADGAARDAARDTADGAVRAGVDRSASLLEGLPDGVVVVGPDGAVVQVNAELERLSMYRSEDLAGRPAELLVPAALQRQHRSWQAEFGRLPRRRLMGRGGPLLLQRKDGSVVPVEISLAPAVVDGTRLTVAVVRDLRPRQRLQQRLELVAALLDTIDDGVVVLDPASGRRVYANRAVTDGTGHSAGGPEPLPIGTPATEQDRLRVQAAVQAVAGGEAERMSVQAWLRPVTGAPYPADVVLTHRPAPPDRPGPGHVVIVSRDITALRAAEARLRAGEESFRAAFDRAPTGMSLTRVDPDGGRVLLRANDALGELLGIPAAGLVGRDVDELAPPEEREALGREVSRLAAGATEHFEQLRSYRRPDGRVVRAELRATLLPAEAFAGLDDAGGATVDGSVVMLSHLFDVTERQQTDRHRRQRTELAELAAQVTADVLADRPMDGIYRQLVDRVAAVLDATDVDLRVGLEGGPFQVASGAEPGPAVSAAFTGAHGSPAALTLTRPAGAADFDETERELLTGFGHQLALVVALGASRTDRERLALLEERQRIGRDLHDTVIQDLIGIGLQLDAYRPSGPDAGTERAFVDEIVEQLDGAVRRLRGFVVELGPPPRRDSFTAVLQALIGNASRALGFVPELSVQGEVDLLPLRVAEDLVAVLQESLANVARHARAGRVVVRVVAGREAVDLQVDDDGVGPPRAPVAGHGMDNIRYRAAVHGGSALLSRQPDGGTRLTWTVPLR